MGVEGSTRLRQKHPGASPAAFEQGEQAVLHQGESALHVGSSSSKGAMEGMVSSPAPSVDCEWPPTCCMIVLVDAWHHGTDSRMLVDPGHLGALMWGTEVQLHVAQSTA